MRDHTSCYAWSDTNEKRTTCTAHHLKWDKHEALLYVRITLGDRCVLVQWPEAISSLVEPQNTPTMSYVAAESHSLKANTADAINLLDVLDVVSGPV